MKKMGSKNKKIVSSPEAIGEEKNLCKKARAKLEELKKRTGVAPTPLVVGKQLPTAPISTRLWNNAKFFFKDVFDNPPLFGLKLLLSPITALIGVLVTRGLSQNDEEGHLEVTDLNGIIFTGQWKYLAIFASNKSAEPIEVNCFELAEGNENPKKLHINVHGVAGNANQFTHITEPTATAFKADQWNITRNPTWTVAGQKEQLRVLIEAAIQQGYTDIRLDGYSYGAGLVRTVYHDLIQDCHEYLENNVTLHYTARNGYESEGLTFGAMLTGYNRKSDANYINGSGKRSQPNFLMKVFDWIDV